ncbi:MAG: NADH-quinone oxidoreductase subunit C [Elusimicrobia bacterium]|nr:NADH-quinone oxidoreductase subunit C [Elusimicrobiota bacterium]
MTISEVVKEKLGNRAIKIFEKNALRYYIDVAPDTIVETVRILFRDMGCRFAIASGIDTPAGFEILYHFSDDKTGKIFTLRTLIADKDNPEIDSITPVICNAEWIEREMFEMLGIKFRNHPNLKRLLLSDNWPRDKYPLRQGSSL